MMSIYWKRMSIFLGIVFLGYSAQAACPQGWTYYGNQKACQLYTKNVLAENCSTLASKSYTSSQICGDGAKGGNCRSQLLNSCQRLQGECRQDNAKKCENDAQCMKIRKCPVQFVVEGVVVGASSAAADPQVIKNSPKGAGQGQSNGSGTGTGSATGSGSGTAKYSGGLGTGEGY